MKMALYRMNNNKYLGNCHVLVVEVDEEALQQSGLTRPEILVFIKTPFEVWRQVTTLDGLRSTDLFLDETPWLRVGSECMFGAFGDTHCDCEQERRLVLREMSIYGGVYVHLPQEAQGMGIFYKAQELHLQVAGYTPDGNYVGEQTQASAAALLTGNRAIDRRTFGLIPTILREAGLISYKYRLVSRNPAKAQELVQHGMSIVGTIDIATVINSENLGEYLSKWLYKSHPLTDQHVEQITRILEGSEPVPQRAIGVINEARLELVTEPDRLKSRTLGSSTSRDKLFQAILDPSNRHIIGAQSELLRMLQRADSYLEYQLEFELDSDLDDYVVETMKPDKEIQQLYETNRYFYLSGMSTTERDLKIRTSYTIDQEFIKGRLIHKIKRRPHEYTIRAIDFSDLALVDIMNRYIFAVYDQQIFRAITTLFNYQPYGMKTVIKRYSDLVRTITVEGDEATVKGWRAKAEMSLGRELVVVIPDKRSFNAQVKGRFDFHECRQLEANAFRRYVRTSND